MDDYTYAGWAPQWVEPEDVSHRTGPEVLSAQQVQQWRDLGVCVVHGAMPDCMALQF
eukprot:SAG31_NODE_18858_length_620_cov_0.984645_1_plen_57_part_00